MIAARRDGDVLEDWQTVRPAGNIDYKLALAIYSGETRTNPRSFKHCGPGVSDVHCEARFYHQSTHLVATCGLQDWLEDITESRLALDVQTHVSNTA
jgi:hypothetical protein